MVTVFVEAQTVGGPQLDRLQPDDRHRAVAQLPGSGRDVPPARAAPACAAQATPRASSARKAPGLR